MKKNRNKKWLIIGIIILLCIPSVFSNALENKETYNHGIYERNGWWNSDWIYRKLITIDSSQVESILNNFPVLINQAFDFDLKTHAQADGDDLVFVLDSDNTKLNHEIEKYDNHTGELVAWVNVPTLSSTVDTKIWMYYGNPDCTSQQNIIGTWNSDYGVVHHFNETDIDGGFKDIKDSTSYHIDGTTSGMNLNDQVPGIIDGSFNFDGINDYMYCANDPKIDFDSTESFTVEIFINITDKGQSGTNNYQYFVDKRAVGWTKGYQLYSEENNFVRFLINDGTSFYISDDSNISDGKWHYITGVRDVATDKLYLYIDGLQATTPITDNSTGNFLNNDNLDIGRAKSDSGYRNAKGSFDELRISAVARTEGWIKTCYNNMNSPETFFTIGEEQIYGGIIISNPYPPDGAIDVELTPTLIISVNHLLGKRMDITWKWNNEGVWEIFGVNSGVYNGTYQKINPNFSKYNTTYQWRVEINDELGNWLNQTYSFTTISENEAPEIIITQPESGFLYIHFFGQQLKIIFQPSFATLIIGKIDINVSVTDNDGVAWVKYYIDDELKETLTQEPYTWTWDEKTIIFPFVLKVTACDYSGNQNSTQMNVWRIQLF